MQVPKKKLIEVAIPLDSINRASAREKAIRHGHPSTLHLWWARRPLAAARAVIFAQMVDDPSVYPDLFPTEKAQEKERQRLFQIIEDLVQWESTTNQGVIRKAREEIWRSWRRACADNVDHPQSMELFDRHKLPAFHDPFAGGGALPLEAQRLGLVSYASDLNPVAVLLNKAMVEIPPKFAGRAPANPQSHQEQQLLRREWRGAQGLAEDVRYYGQWIREAAERRIGHLYPRVEVTEEMATGRPDLQPLLGRKLTVIAWLWARTVKSPNPAFAQVDVPLASTFMLSTKPGKEAYVEPVVDAGGYQFSVKVGQPKDSEAVKRGTKLSGANFRCLMSGTPISGDYIKAEGKSGRMGARLMVVVAEGDGGRIYLRPTEAVEAVARQAEPEWKPSGDVPSRLTGGTCYGYGLTEWSDLFTQRQLVALTTFSDLVQEAREQVKRDAIAAGFPDDELSLNAGGLGATAYAQAIALYLALAVDRAADYGSALCSWHNGPKMQALRNTFGRQALPMVWDFAEGNPFSASSGNWLKNIEWVASALAAAPAEPQSVVGQQDATTQTLSLGKVVSTDPPYYDNIGYADLSDFFYVWLRRSLRNVFPNLFETLAVPKAEELVATPYRHGSKEKAEAFFLGGMTYAMHRLADQAHPAYPVTIYYAFKQAETESTSGTSSTGWETFLGAVIQAGFVITGTWPMRTELGNRMIGMGANALASSIVLVCRKRPATAPTATRREFVQALRVELPEAFSHLQRGNIAPVDLAQAAIGPGMAVYTRYSRVLDADGKPVTVREALALINEVLDETLAEQEGDFDAGTRWALAWFEQVGFAEGEFGVAETLSTAKNTSVAGLADIVDSKRGKVRLLRPAELDANWDPTTDKRLTAWEITHHLIRVLEAGSETHAAELLKKLGSHAEVARELAYRLYTLCERKKRAAEALSYNGLVQSWPEITRLALGGAKPTPEQPTFFDSGEEE